MSIVIGIDHGNGLIKTAHSVFKTGVEEFKGGTPIETDKVVRIGNKYYACDCGHGALKKDKTEDDTYWWLTLAAIGEELKHRDIKDKEIDVILSVGVPLTTSENQRKALKKYLCRKDVAFYYGKKRFKISVIKVLIYSQGYSAIMTRIKDFIEQPVVNVVDVGSWTVDIIQFNYGKANLGKAASLENGCARCIKNIIEQVRRVTDLSVTQEQVEAVLWNGGKIMLPEKAKTEILNAARLYTENLINEIVENGFDTKSAPTVFIGGGATLIKRFYKQSGVFHAEYIEDVRSNALGYEAIAGVVLKAKK